MDPNEVEGSVTDNFHIKVRTSFDQYFHLHNDSFLQSILEQSIRKHPGFSLIKKKNDIALIELNDRIFFSDTVRPACLYIDKNDVDSSVDLTVIGWGLVSAECKNNTGIEFQVIK